MGGTYINPANAITASRYLTLPPFLYVVDRGHYQIALLIVILSAILDNLDGPVARWLDCTSGFGELFDSVTDAICYGFYIACLTAYDRLPLAPVAMFFALGGYNALLRYIYTRRAGRTTNFRSWAMERVAAYSAYLAGAGIADFEAAYYAWAIPLFLVVICAWDTKRMLFDPIPPPPEASGQAVAA